MTHARILPLAGGVVVFAGLIGALGHAIALDKSHAVTPQPQVTQVETAYDKGKKAADAQHALTEAKLNTQLLASQTQISTLNAQKVAACTRLARAGIIIPECRQ